MKHWNNVDAQGTNGGGIFFFWNAFNDENLNVHEKLDKSFQLSKIQNMLNFVSSLTVYHLHLVFDGSPVDCTCLCLYSRIDLHLSLYTMECLVLRIPLHGNSVVRIVHRDMR